MESIWFRLFNLAFNVDLRSLTCGGIGWTINVELWLAWATVNLDDRHANNKSENGER